MSGVTPLNIIVRELKTLAQAHDQVKTFAYGHFLDVIKDNVVEYALVHVNIRSANKAENANTFSIELGVMDKTFKDDSNIQDVESNTCQIFIDLFNNISYSPRWQTLGVVTTPSNPQKFRYKGADEVTGWGGTIGFEIYEGLGFCDVPVTGYDYDAPVTPVLGPAKYQNSDLTFTQSIDPGDTYTAPDISFTDSDGVVSAVPANKDIVATPCVTLPIIYQRPIPTSVYTSYATADDGWHMQNGTYTYENKVGNLSSIDYSAVGNIGRVLSANNSFGNLNRFTDELGTQIFASGYVIDHLTGLGWKIAIHGVGINWANSISGAAALTFATFSDWRVPNYQEQDSLFIYNTSNTMNYSPFNINVSQRLWSSTTQPQSTGNAIALFTLQGTSSAGQSKTSTAQSYMV